jgi:hypothetical protein
MTHTPLRLTLPAKPRSRREQLRFVLPRPLWASLPETQKGTDPAGPLLLSFHGTGFMDDCFRWLSGQAPLPPLRAWRDWCESPAAMLARAGTAAYPATIVRGIPWGLERETDESGLAADGVPDGSPSWLRKLYLPQHDRFTVVVLELICLAAGWPPLDRRRIKEAGLLVRRLRPGDPTGIEQWEDWVATDQRLGSWKLPLQSWEDDPGRDPASRPGLASQPLAVAPSTLAGMGRRCVLTGYLSLTSVEQEVPAAPPPVDTRAKAAEALKGRATERLQALRAAPATDWLPPAIPLRELLEDTLLFTAPATNAVAGALTALGTVLSGDQLDWGLEQVLLALIGSALEFTRFAFDASGAVISSADIWGTALGIATRPAAVPAGSQADWDVLVRDRLNQLLDAWITGQALPVTDRNRSNLFRDALLPALLAAALVRARGCRLALAAAMNAAQGEPTDDLITIEAGRARHSLADLGEGLESFLATERERGTGGGLAPWGTYSRPADAARLERVDHNLRALAEHYAPFEAQLAEAGAEVRFELQERAQALETTMGSALNDLRQRSGQSPATPGIPSLLERGFDLLEPPATGLLMLPGLGEGLANRLSDFTTAVANRYDQTTSQPVAEALVEPQLRRPRFDAHHIYAVQAWVRVSGRAPGEAERVIWSPRSEPFVLAEPADLLGSQPMAVPMPDLPRLLRDLSRLRKAGANPFLTLVPPPRSGAESTGGGLEGLRRDWGMGTAVSLVAPVLAVVGLGMLSSALRIFSRLPGFAWTRQVVIRTPSPERRP